MALRLDFDGSFAMTSARKSVRVRLEGRVQGAGMRAWFEREACNRSLDGFVRNRRDGGVEAVIQGSIADVEAMILLCQNGPASARIDFIKVRDEIDHVPNGFRVVATV
jgi:acylphosphatase